MTSQWRASNYLVYGVRSQDVGEKYWGFLLPSCHRVLGQWDAHPCTQEEGASCWRSFLRCCPLQFSILECKGDPETCIQVHPGHPCLAELQEVGYLIQGSCIYHPAVWGFCSRTGCWVGVQQLPQVCRSLDSRGYYRVLPGREEYHREPNHRTVQPQDPRNYHPRIRNSSCIQGSEAASPSPYKECSPGPRRHGMVSGSHGYLHPPPLCTCTPRSCSSVRGSGHSIASYVASTRDEVNEISQGHSKIVTVLI